VVADKVDLVVLRARLKQWTILCIPARGIGSAPRLDAAGWLAGGSLSYDARFRVRRLLVVNLARSKRNTGSKFLSDRP